MLLGCAKLNPTHVTILIKENNMRDVAIPSAEKYRLFGFRSVGMQHESPLVFPLLSQQKSRGPRFQGPLQRRHKASERGGEPGKAYMAFIAASYSNDHARTL